MSKVSVLLPSLNVVGYIRQCLKSVVGQTFSDIEILCIDSGSTDGTLEVIREFEASDKRVRLLQSDRKSCGYQMNLGIEKATGEYIGIVETDDYIDPEMIGELYQLASHNAADVAKGCFYKVYESADGRSVEKPVHYIPPRQREKAVVVPIADHSIHLWDSNIWNGIYRMDFIREHSIAFEETPGAAFQDIGFRHRVLANNPKIIYTDKAYYHYRFIREGSSTWNDKCLKNMQYEFGTLLNDGRVSNADRSYIYARLIPSFLYEYGKLLQLFHYDSDCPELKFYADWFRKIIKKTYMDSRGSALWISEENDKRLSSFLENEAEYALKLKRNMRRLRKWQNDVIRVSDGAGVIVFGCGELGRKIISFEHQNGIIPKAVLDNNSKLWGKQFEFHTVRSPEKLVDNRKCAFIITTRRSNGVIKEQLMNLGISLDKMIDVPVDDLDFCTALESAPVLLGGKMND